MESVVVVTLIGVGLAILVIAVYLIAIARALMRVSSQLGVVLSTVGRLPEKVAPAEGVLDGINTDLTEAQVLLEGLLAKKLGR
jgi:hypothetical protein